MRHPLLVLVAEIRGGTRRTALRTGQTALLRHGGRDIEIVREIFGPYETYRPPAELEQRLSSPLRILDLGANIGLFGLYALSRLNVAKIVSIEPDAVNVAMLREVVSLNASDDVWTVVEAAVGVSGGTVAFLASGSPDSRLALPGEPAADVNLVDVFGLGREFDLVKLDIEGGEWAILQDSRFAEFAPDVLVMEWHWRGAPLPDPRRAACDLLTEAGYRIVVDRPEAGEQIGLVWAVRTPGVTRGTDDC